MALLASSIYNYGDGVFDRIELDKKTPGDNLRVGDFLKVDTDGAVEVIDAILDDATFVGVCGTLSEDADGPQKILVYTKCIVEVPTASGTYTAGDGLSYSTDAEMVADSDTNTICWVWEATSGASATSVKAVGDVLSLGKLFDAAG